MIIFFIIALLITNSAIFFKSIESFQSIELSVYENIILSEFIFQGPTQQ
jgi:hypothetical protein